MAVDPFAFDTFVVDYTATVDSVTFVESEFGSLQAVFKNRYLEPILGDDGELRTERTEFVSVGSGQEWVATDGGTAFEHVSGNSDRRVRPQSAYGQLLARTTELVGREGMLGDNPAHNYGLHSQDCWVGKAFHWVTEGAGETIKLKDRQSGENKTIISKGKQMPVEFLGAQGALPLADLGSPTDFDVDELGLDESTVSDLMTLAEGYTLGDFQAKGLSILNDLQGDPRRGKLAVALNEPAFYETLRRS